MIGAIQRKDLQYHCGIWLFHQVISRDAYAKLDLAAQPASDIMAYTYGNMISSLKIQWSDLAHGLNEGVLFFASAMRHVGTQKHHYLMNALKAFMPADSTADWLQDEENLTSACLKWGAAMKLHLAHDPFSSTNQKRRIAIRWQSDDTTLYAYMPVNHKRIVTLSATHPLLIRWKDGANDIDVHIRFKAKMDAQSDTRCEYRITFAKSGIYLHNDHNQQPTFHFTIDDIDADPAVRRLWRHEMREQGHVIDDGKEQERMLAGLPAFTAVTKANNRPKVINPNDALWLLQLFLHDHTTPPSIYSLASSDFNTILPPSHVSFQQSFKHFLENHKRPPYEKYWLEKISDVNIKKEAKNIAANILHLLPGEEVQKRLSDRGESVIEMIIAMQGSTPLLPSIIKDYLLVYRYRLSMKL